jgi:RHS repeat-associated protein
VVTDYQYDPQSQRLTSLATGSYAGAADIQDKSYTYSPAGDIETITDSIKTVTYSYYYDFLHRLKAETAEGDITIIPKLEVTFDHIGPGPVHAAKSTTIGGVDYLYEYDINGNMISGPDMTDPKNVLTREISFNAENMPVDINGGQVNITYDADNVRAAKTGGSSTFYINSDYEVIDGVGTKYIFAGNQRIAKITDQTLNYFHQDHLGSASVVSEAETPTIVEAAEYLPFGMTRSANAITTTNYQFTDQEKDSEINLYNYDARLYDPAAGFFISADSIVPDFADPQSLNRYAYVLNNPLIYTDPSGNYWQEEDEGFFEYEGPSISDNTGRDQFLDSISLYQDGTKLSFLPLDSTNLHLETPFMDPVDAVLMFTGVYGLAKGVSQLGLKGLLLPLQNQVGGFIRKGASKNVVNFGQLNVKSTFAHGPFKGQSIANVAKGLRSGRISPNQLPVDYIVRNGERVALNNRSLTALRRAGIEPTKLFDRTGITRFEKLLDSHLGGGATSDFIRIRGAASGTSLIN